MPQGGVARRRCIYALGNGKFLVLSVCREYQGKLWHSFHNGFLIFVKMARIVSSKYAMM